MALLIKTQEKKTLKFGNQETAIQRRQLYLYWC